MRIGSVSATMVLAALTNSAGASDWTAILKFSGEATEASDFAFRLCRPANACETSWSSPPGPMSVSAAVGTTASDLRDSFVAATGATLNSGFIGARRISFFAVPSIRFDAQTGSGGTPASIIGVKRPSDSNWNNLEPNVPVTISGITFTVIEPDLGVAASGGAVPAVTAWGLAALGLAVVVAASVLLRQRVGRAA